MNNSTYYHAIAAAYAEVCSRDSGINKVPNASRQLSKIYEESYGVSGRGREFDEPGEPRRTEYLRIAPSALKKQKEYDARQRLKRNNKVPTKGGKKLFDEFMQEAYAVNGGDKQSKIDHKRMKQVYLSARALEYDKWILFITEMM